MAIKKIEFSGLDEAEGMSVMYTTVYEIMDLRADQIEKNLQLCIRPRPKFMPPRVYKWLLSKMLYMNKFNQQ